MSHIIHNNPNESSFDKIDAKNNCSCSYRRSEFTTVIPRKRIIKVHILSGLFGMNILWYAFKDLKSQKLRALMGIFGVCVSIFLLSSVSFLTDTASASYIDYLTVDSGNIDADIYRRYLVDQPNEPYWFNYTEMISKIKNATDKVAAYLPRDIMYYSANYSDGKTDNLLAYFYFIGLDIDLEESAGHGKFYIIEGGDFVKNGLPPGNCAVSSSLAELMGLEVGDTINISRNRYANYTAVPGYYMNLTVYAIYDSYLKFPSWMEDAVIVDLEDVTHDLYLDKYGFNVTGKCNHLYLLFKDADKLYDIRDISGSIRKVQAIGEEIQLAIGYGYWVRLRKLEYLEYAQYMSVATSIVFIFIGLISMLISGILIGGILSTNVEERIREFGIFRTLGARKSFNIYLVITQGLILCIIGTTLGVFGAMFFVSHILIPGLQRAVISGYTDMSIRFVVQPSSVIISYAIGIGISLLVSISPAVKAARIPIVQAINPYRHEENIYKLAKAGSVNYKLILFGLLLALNGGFIYFIIPRLILSMDFTLMAVTLILILLVFLIGLTMAGIGVMPLFLRFWISVFTPAVKKLINIIKVTIFRYQRRNSSTILMFALSFSFVIFTTGMITIQSEQVTALVEFRRGAPIVLYGSGTGLYTPTVDLQSELMQIDGIEKTSVVIAGPSTLTDLYGGDSGGSFGAKLGDYINLKSADISLYGIDRNYKDTVYSKYIEFKEGNPEKAFSDLFNGSKSCIISNSLAQLMMLHLYDRVRITFIRGDEQIIKEYIVVGIASKMPGFPRFKESDFGGGGMAMGGMFGGGMFGGSAAQTNVRTYGNGVVISEENYIEDMQIPNPAWVSKIFIRPTTTDGEKVAQIVDDINDKLSDKWSFGVVNVIRRIGNTQKEFFMIKLLLTMILSVTVVICMFGIFSSAYSSILERKREIAILRALGLRRSGLGRMFTVESLIIMLASGSTGTLIGFITAALLTENMILFTESPRILTFPWDTVAFLFVLSVIVLLLGMKLLLKKVKKQNLIEIFRQTM